MSYIIRDWKLVEFYIAEIVEVSLTCSDGM